MHKMSQSLPRVPLLTPLTKRKNSSPLIFNAQVALLYLLLTSYCHTCNSTDSATCTPLSLSQDTETDVSTLAFGATSCYAIDHRNASQRELVSRSPYCTDQQSYSFCLPLLPAVRVQGSRRQVPTKMLSTSSAGDPERSPNSYPNQVSSHPHLLPLPLLRISFHVDIVHAREKGPIKSKLADRYVA